MQEEFIIAFKKTAEISDYSQYRIKLLDLKNLLQVIKE